MLKVLLFTCCICLSSFVEEKKDFTYSSSFENNKIKKSYRNDGKNFQYDYGNGQKFWVSPKGRFCIYDGRTYNDRDHDNFDAIVNKLNDGNPTPHYLEPYKHLFKEAAKLDVADGYKKSLENITNRKLKKKIENVVKGWLKKVTSKKYKQRGLVSDDVYRAAYQVLVNGQLTVKNVAKRVKEKIESRAER